MWTIYGHRNKINGKWYIGLTHRLPASSRWGKDGINYKGQVFWKAIKKYGWDSFDHLLLIENVETLDKANKLEIELIKKYNSIENGYNVALGGGVYLRMPVYQLDKNKNIINEFQSIAEAEDELLISNISGCCRNVQKTAGGFYWCYKDNYDTYKISTPKTSPLPKQVYRLDENKNILEKFDSLTLAETKYNLNHSNFIACLNMKRHCCNNMFWCYAKNYDLYNIKEKKVFITKIDQFDLDNNYIKTWQSARQIEDLIGFAHSSILDCCKNKIKQSHNFIWRFNNEN